MRATFPPQAQSIDKGHGRIEERRLWVLEVDGATLGLAGAAQIIRIDRSTQFLRKGHVVKTTHETVCLVTSLWPDQADPQKLLELVRGYWAIEIKQHYRRDHTQREDHCQVRRAIPARNLSLMRSVSIFLFELQRRARLGKKSLPDWQRKNQRNPYPLIDALTG